MHVLYDFLLLCVCVPGPGRSELKRMEQYINQAADDQSSQPPSSSSSNQQQPSSSPPSSSSKPFGSLGMMRMPGRGGRRVDPRLVPGVGDETIEASLLGDLAVLTITDDSHQVYYNNNICICILLCLVLRPIAFSVQCCLLKLINGFLLEKPRSLLDHFCTCACV